VEEVPPFALVTEQEIEPRAHPLGRADSVMTYVWNVSTPLYSFI